MITMAHVWEGSTDVLSRWTVPSEIARRTSLSRSTFRKWIKEPEGVEPRYRRREVPGKLVPFEAQLLQALEADARRPRASAGRR